MAEMTKFSLIICKAKELKIVIVDILIYVSHENKTACKFKHLRGKKIVFSLLFKLLSKILG